MRAERDAFRAWRGALPGDAQAKIEEVIA